MKKVLTVLIFVFLPVTVAANEVSSNLGYDKTCQTAKFAAKAGGVSDFLVPASIKAVTTSNTDALLLAANSEDSKNQQERGDVHKPGHNHDRKAKSKYDLRDIDGKHGGDGDKHVHKHGDNHDNKPKSKYDLREIGGHKHGEGHHHEHGHNHEHGEAHHHDHGHDHHHDGEAHHHDHGDDHHHHHGEAEGHGHGHEHDGHDDQGAHGHEHGHDHGHEHGHDHEHEHEHGGWEPPEGLYDRLWDVVTLG